ncbi:MAG TPA: amidohydrolase family protein [Pyrinomonadaceae bacterium]|jgi:imidazolonepropionase-like amidohydrolase|nr:amidohydrolase family protein [Pyrinomonadaceae bacterium]
MKRRLLTFLLLLIVSSAARGQVTAIRAGRLIDPETGAAAAQNQIILVEKDKIKAVGPDVKIPSGAAVIDLSRSTVMPGLFDAHTHLCMSVNMQRDRGSYYYTTLNDPDTFRSVQGVVNARTMLESGFTTVRDVGNEGNYACVSVRRAIEQGMIPGPTMQTAGRIIAPFGGQFHVRPDKRGLAEPEYFFADTRDELRKAVRENAHFGARVIKLVVDDQPYIYSVEDIRFVIEEARLMGLKVAAHCWTQAGAHNAAEAGVASIEHANGISEEDLAVAKRNGVVMAFTPFPEWMLGQFRSDKEGIAKEYRDVIDRLGAAYRLGLPIAFATDAILDLPEYTRGTQSITWVDSYVAAGMPPREILKAMTANAARLLGVEAERGAIRPGLFADIIATPDNPLDKIDALKRVHFVMKNGAVVKHDKR